MKKLQLWAVGFCLLVFSAGALAQVANGVLTGTILDPSGAAVVNAKITVTNLATNLSLTTTTNQTGSYSVRELPVGTYKVSAEAPGFKTVANASVVVNAGTTQRIDFKMELGQTREVVEVSGEGAAVNTDDSKLSTTVNSTQISNLPLNGRNVYDLIQLAPGAVNVAGVDFENGHNTVVNGVRENFNGFMINGIDNKGLSGGVVTTPIEDTVQEFQQLTLNNSAQYGSSAGSINNLVTKSGSNSIHGSGWYYGRNDVFDANEFFLNQQNVKRPPLRFSQYGGSLGGALIKDKLFFFGAIQNDHFNTSAPPATVTQEDPAFAQLVASTFPTSVSNLLFSTFPSALQGSQAFSFSSYSTAGLSGSGFGTGCIGATDSQGNCLGTLTGINDWLCPSNYKADPAGPNRIPLLFAQLFGYNPATDNGGCPSPLNAAGAAYNTPTLLAHRSLPFLDTGVASFASQAQVLGNLFNGKEWSGRLDYNPNSNNRFYANYAWYRATDKYGPLKPQGVRGFTNPLRNLYPSGQLSWVHTFTPTIVNEARAGYTQNNQFIGAVDPGVPQVAFDDGSLGFGSYAGYPQFFKENIYQYSDMVSMNHGNHSIKIGVDIRRNIENSEFNVARPSYYFFDMAFFAIDAPHDQTAGVDPGICRPPCKTFNQTPQAQLSSNIRHWRNIEAGLYFQDDWKATKRLTLNLGIRWDKYQRHNELNNLATTFLKGPGNNVIDNISTGAGWLRDANIPAGAAGCTTDPQLKLAQLAGVCGPGGFAPASSLGKGRSKDFGPRLGFAWDVFGDGKTSLRGGFGISYEGTLYNPLSNSRWNLPYYSFNDATNFLAGDVSTVVYGPFGAGCPNCSVTPTFSGSATNVGQGVGAQAAGNLTGWVSDNANLAFLTGIIQPQGVDDPYVYNHYLSLQREIAGKWVVEADYVGTVGHKLFRSEDINRIAGGRLPKGACVTDNFGRQLCSQVGANNAVGRLNPNYGRLREWQNVVNSNYNALQVQAKRQMSRGLLFNANYTWSHSIDNGSGWHNSATGANGAAAGDGFTTDQTLPGLDRGNSIFDIRHRVVFNYVWQIPGPAHGILGAIAGGWQYSGIWSFQSGAHWEPYRSSTRRLVNSAGDSCSAADVTAGNCVNKGGDYNLDAVANDRPNSSVAGYGSATHDQWANGWFANAKPVNITFSAPCLGCVSNLGRNTFVGPGQWYADMTMSKIFKVTERFNLKFEAQGFNVFNRANFLLATPQAGAHNKITDPLFGGAVSTLNARNIQLGLKLSF